MILTLARVLITRALLVRERDTYQTRASLKETLNLVVQGELMYYNLAVKRKKVGLARLMIVQLNFTQFPMIKYFKSFNVKNSILQDSNIKLKTYESYPVSNSL